ncbi:MAG: GAF domain-containing protein, partial [Anaerolineales bacterium]
MANFISFLKVLIAPHPSIEELSERRRAQILASLTIAVMSFIAIVSIISIQQYGTLSIFLLPLMFFYVLSRTRYHSIGAYLFVYSIVLMGVFRVYQGQAVSVETAMIVSTLVAMIIASGLFPQPSFLILLLFSSVAAFSTSLYSNVPSNTTDNNIRTGVIVVFMGVLLYAINFFRARLDRAYLEDISDIKADLNNLQSDFESRVTNRTSELLRINAEIQTRATKLLTVSDISQSIAINIEKKLAEILSNTVHLISEKTGYYHVGIFLLDENKEYAVLRAANSEGGQKMLARHHQLRVGGTGIVGYVSQGGRARIALDTGADAVFFNNPDLPETRSEMALPLKFGSRIIGVLDVQSKQPTAFNEEDVAVLGTLANQVAIVIQNALIIENPGSSLSRENPSMVLSREKQKGFSYLPDGTITSISLSDSSVTSKALTTGEITMLEQNQNNPTSKLAVPVKLRDNVVGVIHLEASQNNRKWTDDESALIQSVSERAALALENARLFEETEKI